MLRCFKNENMFLQLKMTPFMGAFMARNISYSLPLANEEGSQKGIKHFMDALNQYQIPDESEEHSSTNSLSGSFSADSKKHGFALDGNNEKKKENVTTSSLMELKELLRDLKMKSGIKDVPAYEEEDDYSAIFRYNKLSGLKALPEYLEFEKTQISALTPIVANLTEQITTDKQFFEFLLKYVELLGSSETTKSGLEFASIQDPVRCDLDIKQPIAENIKLLIWQMFTNKDISGFIPDSRKLHYLQLVRKNKAGLLLKDVDMINLELVLVWNVYRDVGKINDVLYSSDSGTVFDYNTLTILSFIENCHHAGGYNAWDGDRYVTDISQLSYFDKIGLKPYLNSQKRKSLFTEWYISQLNSFQQVPGSKTNLLRFKNINELQSSNGVNIHPNSSLAKNLNDLKNFIFKLRNTNIEI